MMLLGFFGHSNSGKTTLIDRLVGRYRRRGLSVAVLKHTAHRGFELDSEGTDSWRHGKAGAAAVGLLAEGRAALLLHRLPRQRRPRPGATGAVPDDAASLVRLVGEAVSPDILFLEGFKHAALEKVAVGDIGSLPGTVLRVDPASRRSVAAMERFIDRRLLVQRVADRLPGIDCGRCGLDCARFAAAVADRRRRPEQCVNLSDIRLSVRVDGEELRLGRFPREVVASALLGLVSPLKLPRAAGGRARASRRIRRVEIRLER
ncbi:MAG: molybdopterin-guanine dinucleotide biosynthesis protein B [Euryarchaeota archaeon]|nr:molybdopterin-guanine dinucleotide biosynthesis protein B [Euryarchaeota archaeon]